MFLLNFAILVEFFRVYFNLRDLNLSKFSMVYAYLGAYTYCFGELFLGLCLFGGLRLLGSVEYIADSAKSSSHGSNWLSWLDEDSKGHQGLFTN